MLAVLAAAAVRPDHLVPRQVALVTLHQHHHHKAIMVEMAFLLELIISRQAVAEVLAKEGQMELLVNLETAATVRRHQFLALR